jgi:protein arginine N-methyltransferase 1
MYGLRGYGDMLVDRVRMDAYARALERAVKPGSVVVDLGAGTGVMSLLACKLGARRVHAVEPSPLSALIAEAARDNGMQERIVVHAARSSAVELPERADVIVSDLRGVLPPFHSHLSDLADVRTRWLAPGGRLIPQADTLFVALVSAAETFAERRAPWEHAPDGVSLRASLRVVDQTWQKLRAQPEALLSRAQRWATLDYPSIASAHVKGAAELEVVADGTAHGLLAWFDTVLLDDVGFSNRPGAPEAIYGQAFFPWPEPVALHEGERVAVELRADPLGGETLWTWTTELPASARASRPARRFRQSDALAATITSDALHKRAASFVPTLSSDGELTLRALQRMQSGSSLEALAHELHAHAPKRFRSFDQALDFVAELSARHAR